MQKYSGFLHGLQKQIECYSMETEYDDKNYDGMKKVYSLWIMLKAPKRKDGHMNAYETNERIICGATVEEKEVYDKEVILVVYSNKEHDLNKK